MIFHRFFLQDAQKFLENFLRQIYTECSAILGTDKTIGGKRNPVEENFYLYHRCTSFCESYVLLNLTVKIKFLRHSLCATQMQSPAKWVSSLTYVWSNRVSGMMS